MSSKRERQAARRAELEAKKSRRRFILGAGGVVALAGAGYGLSAFIAAPPPAQGALPFDPASDIQDTDVVIGKADAPVTVVEYASLTCPHCARFHNESLPEFLKGWVDTGKARLVFRHYPLDGSALKAAAAVSCLDQQYRQGAVSILFKNPGRWAPAQDPAAEALALLPLGAGEITRASACVAEGVTTQKIMGPVAQARAGGVSSTPSFVIKGKVYPGFMSAEKLGALVDAAI